MKNNFNYTDSFLTAQNYERASNNNFANNDTVYKEYSKDLLLRTQKYRESGEITMFDKFGYIDDTRENIGWLKEFFSSSSKEYLQFNDAIKEKNNLEIGSGPCGFLNTAFWLKKRNIIEPLLNDYKENQLKNYGKSWFDDECLNCYSQPAEILIPELINKIDGVTICRNCLDHTQNYKDVMENISKYSSPGSFLLFWSDIFHLKGTDIGHFNITNDKSYFKNYIKDLGFEILNEWSIPESERGCINIGFKAQRI